MVSLPSKSIFFTFYCKRNIPTFSVFEGKETYEPFVNRIWSLKAERPSTHMSTKYGL
jgi:hypothetical protein